MEKRIDFEWLNEAKEDADPQRAVDCNWLFMNRFQFYVSHSEQQKTEIIVRTENGEKNRFDVWFSIERD